MFSHCLQRSQHRVCISRTLWWYLGKIQAESYLAENLHQTPALHPGHLRLTTPKKNPEIYKTHRTGRSALKADAKTQHQNIWSAISTFQYKRIQPGTPPFLRVFVFRTSFSMPDSKFNLIIRINKALTSKIPLTTGSRWTPLIYTTSKQTLSNVLFSYYYC
jgi:hypothetical protein